MVPVDASNSQLQESGINGFTLSPIYEQDMEFGTQQLNMNDDQMADYDDYDSDK